MRAILVHGMGRSPLSQLLLAKRLRSFGIQVELFGYSTLRPFDASLNRLVTRIVEPGDDEPFILVGHSLGCVLIRAALPRLRGLRPSACFFMAPPNRVPKAARNFASTRLYRLLTGDSGQLISNEAFMAALPVPEGPVRVYAGTAGCRGRLSPFRDDPNHEVLAVTAAASAPVHGPMLFQTLHALPQHQPAR